MVLKKDNFEKENYGNGKNIIDGLKYVFKKHKSAIILEDDLEIEQNFLSFMNPVLNKYRNNKKVWHISGWNFDFRPLHSNFDVFFFKKYELLGMGNLER